MDGDQATSAPCSPRPTSLASKVAEEDRFRFTPVASKTKPPRLWDRKPSTPFQARDKSRKVWKRFFSFFGSMKQSGRGQDDAEDEQLTEEINGSANAGVVRGVKRQCLGAGDAEACVDTGAERGRSFLETKWELEATKTRHKHAMKPDDNTESIDAVNTEQELSTEVSGMESHDEVDHGESDTEEVPQEEDRHVSTSDPGSMDMGSSKDDQTADNPTSTPDSAQDASSSSGDIQSPRPQTPDGTENSAVEKPDEAHDDAVAPSPSTGCMLQENEKVNSTAREATDDAVEKEITTDETSSGEQDGQDSTQENDTAAAADVKELNAEQEKNLIRSALRLSELDGEDAELLSDFLTRAQAKRAANAALTPRETDKAVISDSPTPRARRALGELDGNSPSPQKPSPSKAASSPEAEKTDDQQSATPGCRRSSRTRAAKQQEQAVPNRIPLRRANGTELVFLPRTEAQELALTTRRNTRRNKGDAQLPRIALQAMAQKQEAEQAEPEGSAEESQRRSKRAGGKQVSWNEQRLVEYAHDDVPVEPAPAASAARAPRRPPTGAKSAAAPALPRASSTTKPSTPVGQRKKLTPKSPSAALLGTPASKAIGKAAVKTGTTSSSRSSSSSSKTAAGVKKSSSILKAGAGSTPMPKRVRAAKK